MKTMQKRTGKFEDDATFWAAVAECDWATRSQERHGYKALKREILANWDLEFTYSFYVEMNRKLQQLTLAIDKWEDATSKRIPCGDDSFNDLRYHIIGLGREMFEVTVQNPRMAYERAQNYDYVESFSYVFPHASEFPKEITMEEAREKARETLNWHDSEPTEDDIEMLALRTKYRGKAQEMPEYYAAWARTELPWVSQLANHPLGLLVDRPLLLKVEEALSQMGAGNLDQDWEELKAHVKNLRDKCNAVYQDEHAKIAILLRKGYGLENMLSDANESGMGGVS